MAGGPLFPSSVDFGSSGLVYEATYTPATNTSGAGTSTGIGVIASLSADATIVLQFNMPPTSLPTGTLKLRSLARANATAGVAKVTVKDKNVAPGANPGAATMNTETQLSRTWATADIWVEDKVTLTSAPAAGDILAVPVTFNTTLWTLAAASVWQFSLIWE